MQKIECGFYVAESTCDLPSSEKATEKLCESAVIEESNSGFLSLYLPFCFFKFSSFMELKNNFF